MDLKACVEPKFCGGDGNLHVKCLTSDAREDDDDVLLPTMISLTASLGTCNNKRDVSIKRKLDDSNSLHIKVKKSKVSTYVDHGKYEDDIHFSDKIIRPGKLADNSFSSLKRDLALLEKLFEEGRRMTRVEDKRLQSIKREIEMCCKELENKKKKVSFVRRMKEAHYKMQGKIEECIKDFVVKEGQLHLMEDLIAKRTQELKTKEIELNQVKGNISKEIELCLVIDKIDKERGRKEDELEALSQKIAECRLELKAKEKELDAMNKLIGGQMKEFEVQVKELKSKEKQYQGQVEELESNKKHFEGRVKDLETRERQLEGREKEFESKEEKFKGQMKELEFKKEQFESQLKVLESIDKQLAGQAKEFETKEKEFEGRVKEMESIKKHFERRVNELESKENILVGREKEFESKKKDFELPLKQLVKELESKQKYFKGRMKVLESIEQLEGRVRELESKERELEDHVKDIESKEEDLEGRVKDIKLKEEELDGRVKEFESNKKHFESQFQKFTSKEKQFERFWKEPELEENKFKVKVKGLNLKEKLFEGQVSDLESELTEKQCEVLTKYIVEEKDSGLQLDKCEKTDPAKLVLDIILNPTIPLSDKKGDNAAVIINDSCIYLLEQLMRISPNIKPCVREEALKLALDLKANMKENTEISLGVLGFLLLLAVYGLVTSFIEDEILELFAIVAHHKIAMELFRTLGFANKVSDFVENLIKKKQFIGAVRFSCEYNLADKNQLVDLLQEHVRNAKQICESSCKNSNSIEIKDKARDQEIAILGSVLQCISDHSLEPKDLFNKEIKCRILELKGHRGS